MVGDVFIVSGMVFEVLNYVGVININLLVVLNDNVIGIDLSVGVLKEYLIKVILENILEIDNIFEVLNFIYVGLIDGYDIYVLIEEFNRLKNVFGFKILYVIIIKGKGFC